MERDSEANPLLPHHFQVFCHCFRNLRAIQWKRLFIKARLCLNEPDTSAITLPPCFPVMMINVDNFLCDSKRGSTAVLCSTRRDAPQILTRGALLFLKCSTKPNKTVGYHNNFRRFPSVNRGPLAFFASNKPAL